MKQTKILNYSFLLICIIIILLGLFYLYHYLTKTTDSFINNSISSTLIQNYYNGEPIIKTINNEGVVDINIQTITKESPCETIASNNIGLYGIDNKSVLYPISPNGITAGLPDPPIPSNGPNGNGPIGRDINSGEGMSGKGMYLGSGGGNQSTLAPQSLVNLSRSLTGGVTEIFNGFGGYTNSDSLNPMPYDQPIGRQDIAYLRTNFPNVEQSYNKADERVSTF